MSYKFDKATRTIEVGAKFKANVAEYGSGREKTAEVEIEHPTYDYATRSETMCIDVPLDALADLLRSAGYSVKAPSKPELLEAILYRDTSDPNINTLAVDSGLDHATVRRKLNTLAKRGFKNRIDLILTRTRTPTGSIYEWKLERSSPPPAG